MSDEGYTVPEVAMLLGVSESTIWRWIREKRIQAEHYGPLGHGLTRITEAALAKAPFPQDVGKRADAYGR